MADESTTPDLDAIAAAVRGAIQIPASIMFTLSSYDNGVHDIIRVDADRPGFVVVGFKDLEIVIASARVKKIHRFLYSDPDHVAKAVAFIHEQMAEWDPEELDIHDYIRSSTMVMNERLLKAHHA